MTTSKRSNYKETSFMLRIYFSYFMLHQQFNVFSGLPLQGTAVKLMPFEFYITCHDLKNFFYTTSTVIFPPLIGVRRVVSMCFLRLLHSALITYFKIYLTLSNLTNLFHITIKEQDSCRIRICAQNKNLCLNYF